MAKRFVLGSLLALSGVFFLPIQLYAAVVYDYLDIQDTGGSISVDNYSPIAQRETIGRREFHISWFATSTSYTFNQVTIGDLGYNVIATTTPQDSDSMYMYILPYATSSIESEEYTINDAIATFIPYSVAEYTTDADTIFISPNGSITLNPNQYYTFVIFFNYDGCIYPDCLYDFTADFEYSDGNAYKGDVRNPVYTYSRYTDTYSTYTNQPDSFGMTLELDYTIEEFYRNTFINIFGLVGITTAGLEEPITDCEASTLTAPIVYCNTSTSLQGLTHGTIVNEGLFAGEYNLITKIVSITNEQIYSNGSPMATLSLLTGDGYNMQQFTHHYIGTISSSTPYQIKACFTDKTYTGDEYNCAVVVLCNGEFSSKTECQTNYESSLVLSGVNPVINGGQVPATTTASSTETFFQEAFNTIKYGFPYGYLVYLYEAWELYQSENSTTSTTTDFIIGFNVGSYFDSNTGLDPEIPIATTTWNMTAAYRDGLAQYDTAGLVDRVDQFLWAIFGLFLVWRIATDSWQGMARGVGDSYISGRRRYGQLNDEAGIAAYNAGQVTAWYRNPKAFEKRLKK